MVRELSLLEKGITSSERFLLNRLGTHFLSFSEVNEMVGFLAEQSSEFNPDCVVGLLNSGKYFGKNLSRLLDSDYQDLDVSRDSPQLFGMPLKDRIGISKLPIIQNKNVLRVKGEFKKKGYERILIADEECGYGLTFKMAKEHIQEKEKQAEIKEASIFICKEGYMPNYFFDKTISLNSLICRTRRFPWSVQSPYYGEYLDWIKSQEDDSK